VEAATQLKTTGVAVLRHPIRVRILEAANLREKLSPSEFVYQGLGDDIESVREKTPGKDRVSHVGYHFRKLEEARCVQLVEERPVRGAIEHFYRATGAAFFSDEQWSQLSLQERGEVSRVVWQTFIALVEGAMMTQTFDERVDRWLASDVLKLDEKGWLEMTASIRRCFDEVAQIKQDAQARLEETGEAPMRASFGIFGFPSPSLPSPDP
jgi:hypothetical protein